MAGWTTNDIADLRGRLAIITGATGGLGLQTALVLAAKGAEVVLAARNPQKGADAVALIRARYPAVKVRFDLLDLGDLSSVAAFADRHVAAGRPIDMLINNAGVMALPKRQETADGFEMQFGTNYLSHFALTGRLLPLLTAAKARVVQLSSVAHRGGRIRLEDLNYRKGYRPWPVYQQSKLVMLMFAIELQRRNAANGWGLTSVAAHPGVSRTDLMANGPEHGSTGGSLSGFLVRRFAQSAERGALPTLMAATWPGVTPGGYYGPQGLGEMRGRPGVARIDPAALDADVARRLWTESEHLTGVRWG
ncbi:short-chain dehydrogenase [Brevundimonas sp. Leaf363]|uniref:SDR family oxidoreductase n=1 Tax=Brevundimonas sp. Leaf363 TaxID=1736353 RepID=UPI0006FC8147|nr:SDR family oxidoreductase [Brevundimonas sp. Leaf363]KQS54367.1 short-chain dehydrogenase [Brevundimonas sp. Leaf363]